MTKIDLITGILGSGKTTFLLKYARHCIDMGENIAILENDFGAVNIDMMMLQELKGERCRLEMIAGGCDADCHRRRFKTQLISLGMQHFDRVIVEPSGIFDMDEFFDILHDPPMDRWFETGSVLTIADGEMDSQFSPQMEYLLGSEAACCGKLVISKLRGEADTALVQSILDHVNRALEDIRCDRRLSLRDVVAKDWESFSEEDFEAISNSGYIPESYVKVLSENTDYSSFYYLHVKATPDELKEIAERILKECMGVFRIKGFVKQDDSWFELNAAKGNVEVSPICNGQEIIIVIGENMEKNQIDKFFE